jgi:thioesterase domain-containing protein
VGRLLASQSKLNKRSTHKRATYPPPFFCLPGSGGHVLSLYDLARFGDPEQPFFGLEFPGQAPGETALTQIEDMATRLLAEVRKIQPEGPYRLGGYSFGGIVAFEMAQQLFALGQDVSHLIMIDTWGKNYPTRLPLPGRIIDHLQKLRTLSLAEKLAYASEKGAALFRKLGRRNPPAAEETPAADPATGAQPEAFQVVYEVNRRAWHIYVPRSYPGRLILLQAERQPDWVGSRFDDPYMGWKPFAAGAIDVQTIPGAHLTVLDKPNVRSLAERVSACLRP